MRKHKYFECKCGKLGCQFCSGGLAFCTVCGGAEGTLTTECCGRKITKEEEDRIYKQGDLDFRDGKWISGTHGWSPEMIEIKRICTSKPLDHSTARKVLKQLKTNPEVCEECRIKPCVFALYLWGK